jgi:hypothetical protein
MMEVFGLALQMGCIVMMELPLTTLKVMRVRNNDVHELREKKYFNAPVDHNAQTIKTG